MQRNKHEWVLLHPLPIPDRIFQFIATDAVGPFRTDSRGFTYVLTCIDHLSNFVIARAVRANTSHEVAKFLLEDVFLKYGFSETLLSDNGSQYTAEIMKHLMSMLKENHKFTTA